MAKASKTWKLVITTIILSLVFITAFVAVFINIIVPTYDITREEIYEILSKVFPILIGLVLIEIGVLVGKRDGDEYKDTIDKLSPNAYDSALYSPALDDPMTRGAVGANSLYNRMSEGREIIREIPVEVVKEVEAPVEVVKEVPVEIEKEVPVEVIREVEVIKEIPVEIIKEVPVEVIREVPVEIEVIREVPIEIEVVKEVPFEVEVIREVPVEVIKEVPAESETIIKQVCTPVEVMVPYEVIKEVEVPVDVIKEVRVPGETIEVVKEVEVPVEVIKEVEIPVEVVKEVPVEVIKEVEKEVPVEVIREIQVPVEIIKEVEVIKEIEKEVPVEVIKEVFIEVDNGTKNELLSFDSALQTEIEEAVEGRYDISIAAFRDRDEESILKVLGADTIIYSDGLYIYAALPFYSKAEAEKATRLLAPRKVVSLGGRKIDAAALIKEASKGL